MNQDTERFVLVPLVLHPVDGVIGDEVRHIPVLLYRIIILGDEVRVIIIALSGHNLPIIEAGRQAFEVPFADEGRFITGLLQEFRKGLLRSVEHASGVVVELVGATVLTGNHAGTAGSA